MAQTADVGHPPGTNNQLSGFAYDAAGNMITNGGSTSYIYDAENRLIWTSGYRYVYDGDGDRAEKCVAATSTTPCPTSGTNGTLYWRGRGSDTLDETDLSGNVLEEYIYFNGQRVARREVSGSGGTIAVHYYFSDHLGSHGVVENATASACEQDVDYYPYGGEENDYCSTQVAQHYKFTGKERDTESGLDNFGARYEASNLGRFMTPDWAAKPATVPYAKFGDPQTLNLYAYTENGPVNKVDADGHTLSILSLESILGQASDLGSMLMANAEAHWASLQQQAAQGQTQPVADTGQTGQAQNLSDKSEKAILNSNLTGEQANAFESAVKATGSADGINPNALVGIAFKESSLNPAAQSSTSTASGLFGLTDNIKSTYGLSAADATGTSPSAITKQVSAAGGYLHDLMQGSVPAGHPSHQFEIALGYFRGTRRSVNRAIASKGGYNSMLKLRFGGESLRHYISGVESFQ